MTNLEWEQVNVAYWRMGGFELRFQKSFWVLYASGRMIGAAYRSLLDAKNEVEVLLQ